jgi:hypothetical protein
MSKHTPGPWQVNHWDHLQVCDSSDERGCAPIAHIVKTGEPKPRAEDIANARLIAAAPDLLEALKGAAFLLEAVSPSAERVGCDAYKYEAAKLRALIAKATGEQP